jgi:hypothetical protein
MTPHAAVHPVRLAALLALIAMFGPFTIDAFFPAFHAVQKDLGRQRLADAADDQRVPVGVRADEPVPRARSRTRTGAGA